MAGERAPARRPLSELLAAAEPLSIGERRAIVHAAQVVIEQLYVHLPLKRAMHAVDPVQRLRLLDRRLPAYSDRRFHDEMIATFVSLRDLHTTYTLPVPYAGTTATLPFRIESYWDGDVEHFVVTNVAGGTDLPPFAVGVEVTHWNGIPIGRAVALNGERNSGANADARLARGLASLAQRPMGRLAPPDEEWIELTFLAGGEAHEQRFAWEVVEPSPAPVTLVGTPVGGDGLGARVVEEDGLGRAIGLDALVEDIRRAQKLLFAPGAMARERAMADRSADSAPLDPHEVSKLPDVLEFRAVAGPRGDVGYLRIRTFKVGPLVAFLDEVVRILALLPQDGLVIDVRGNGGGILAAGERLLQLFTPRRIEPEHLHLVSTPLTLKLTTRPGAFLEPWSASIAESVETGAPFSDGLPLSPQHTELCNDRGQRYHGPVVLVTDALCYSTTDIFAAGFQDHEIGPLLGTSANTGAGGANVWEYGDLLAALPDELAPLPRHASMRVAIRRTTRVGRRAGDLVEDLGVAPDQIHRMTRRDLLESNVDLIAAAARLLAERPSRTLVATATPSDGAADLSVTTAGLNRIDVYVDERPVSTLDVADGPHALRVELEQGAAHVIDLRGFSAGELVARRALTISR